MRLETDDIIAAIYEGPLEPEPWQSFVQHLRQRMDCDTAAITVTPGRPGMGPRNVRASRLSIEPAVMARATAEQQRLANVDPLANALQRAGDIFTIDEVIDRRELTSSEFYQLVMRPKRMEFMLGMRIEEPSGWKSNVGIINSETGRNFGDHEKAFLLSCRPHLERALALFARVRRFEAEKEVLEATLDRLSIGMCILNQHGRVLDANHLGRYASQNIDGVRIINGQLGLSRSESNAKLHRMIAHALEWRERGRGNDFVDALKVDGAAGDTVGILVRSIPKSDQYQSDVSPSVIVYFGVSSIEKLASERFVAQLFGLTPVEAELATLVANGYTLGDAAIQMHLTESTVRTYMKTIFSKVGVQRQVDLVRLILKSVALLG